MFLFALPLIHHAKKEIRKEVKYKILKRRFNESEFIKFSALELKNADWEDAEEFFYDGSMYDVVKTEIDENGLKHYYCIKDHKENYIYPLKKIADLFKKKNLKLAFNAHQENNFSHQQYTLYHLKEYIDIVHYFQPDKAKVYPLELMNYQNFYSPLFIPPKNFC